MPPKPKEPSFRLGRPPNPLYRFEELRKGQTFAVTLQESGALTVKSLRQRLSDACSRRSDGKKLFRPMIVGTSVIVKRLA